MFSHVFMQIIFKLFRCTTTRKFTKIPQGQSLLSISLKHFYCSNVKLSNYRALKSFYQMKRLIKPTIINSVYEGYATGIKHRDK